MFTLKQFSVSHTNSTQAVGTDALLLGALACAPNPNHILDIGTGCGIIALMLAQTYPKATITAIEPDEASYKEATNNTLASTFNNLSIKLCSLQEFIPKAPLDLIVSNPPFFKNSLQSPSESRNKARHSQTLAINEIIEFATNYLTSKGKLMVILPFLEEENVLKSVEKSDLYVTELYHIQHTKNSKTTRSVFTMEKVKPEKAMHSQLTIKQGKHFSDPYKTLMGAFMPNRHLQKS